MRRSGSLPSGAQVVVVGAGITGAALADELSRAGAEVVVVDETTVAARATGRSGAMVRAYDPNPVVRDLAARSLAVYADADLWPDGRAPLQRRGAVTVCDAGLLPSLRAQVAELPGASVVTDDEVRGVRLDDGVGVVEDIAGFVDAVGVTHALFGRAMTHGAQVFVGVSVQRIDSLDGRVRLATNRGTLDADIVVLAIGGLAAHPPKGVRITPPVRTRAIQVSVVQRPSGADHATFIDTRSGAYARPLDDAHSLIGSPLLVWDEDPRIGTPPDAGHERRTTELVARNLPWVADAPRVRTVRATDGYQDELSGDLVHPAGVDGVWCVRGWNGGGVKVAPEAARRMAATLAGTDLALAQRGTHQR